MIGSFLPLPAAVALAFVVAVFGVRVVGGALGRIIPRDETTAVSDASLVGRVGTIVIGTARAGKPAQARVRDEHGASHYVMVEPEEPRSGLRIGRERSARAAPERPAVPGDPQSETRAALARRHHRRLGWTYWAVDFMTHR